MKVDKESFREFWKERIKGGGDQPKNITETHHKEIKANKLINIPSGISDRERRDLNHTLSTTPHENSYELYSSCFLQYVPQHKSIAPWE